VARVSGRSGTEHNARQLAAAIEATDLRPEDRIGLVGYSKGAVDILRFLTDFPDLAAQVVVVASVAGPILGSPLADLGEWTYANLISGAFEERCEPGDGGVVASLVPERRRQWLLDHSLPSHVRYLSLAAFTTREHLARGLVPTWEILANTDTRNDGQVLIGDAVIPGSDLLGYANADHWGIALTIEEALPHLAARPDPAPFPRDALLEALFLYADEALAEP
jgi:pimeloyl-ACP methyl ester carboxylesterase